MSEIADPLEELSQATVTLDPIRYYNTLLSFPGDIWEMVSSESNNIFHEIALSVIREQKLLEFLDQAVLFVNLIQIKNKYPDNYTEVFSRLLNHKNNEEGRTPLHIAIMASRRVKFIQNLTYCYIKLGADYKIVDSKGKGVIHLAASAGQLALIARFHKEFNIPLSIKDSDGRTALHTAAFEGQEQSSTALIAWSQDMNEQDNEGNTPLHLSTLAKSYRIIRHLLMRGASREITNNEGFTALNLAEQHGVSIQIREALSPQSWFANFNPIGTPLKPVANSYSAFCVFLFVFVGRWGSIFLFVIPHLEFWFGVAFCVSFIVNFLLFQIASNTNPGYAEKDPKMNIFSLYERYNGDFVCAYCEVRRSYQIKHCQHCNRCVKKFDHHCPWIHNCVGNNNHFTFFLFLLVIEADFLFTLIIGILDELEIVQGDGLYNEIFDNEPWNSCGETVSFVVGIISGFLFILVLPLFYVQLVNVIKNTTTHERFAYNVLFKQKIKDGKGRESHSSKDSDTSSMLLANEDNEITHLTGRLSPISDSEVSVQETTTKCFCFKKKSVVDWQKLNEEESNKG